MARLSFAAVMADAPTVAELQSLADSAAALSRKLKKTQGLSEGHVERIASAIERILRDYGGASYRQYRNLVRDLDVVAADVTRLEKEKALHPKFVRTLDASLLRIRKRDFFLGRRLVDRLGKVRAQARERDRLLADYREGYKEIEREIARLKAERDRLRTVRKPPMSETDVERVRTMLRDANTAINAAIIAELHGVPCHLALPTFLEGSRDRRLLLPPIPEEDALTLFVLLSDVGPMRDAFGNRGVHGLLEALSYSDAKLAHLVGDGRPLRAALNANLPWLKAITAPGNLLPQLGIDLSLDALRERTESLQRFAEHLHDAGEARDRIRAVAERISAGDLAKAQDADRGYRVSGEAARRAWEGTLDPAIREVERDLDRAAKDLASLSPPDRLA